MATNSNIMPQNALPKDSERESKRSFFNLSQNFDMPILIILILLLSIGLITLLSSSYVYSHYEYNDSFYIIKKQVKFAILGIAIMLFVSAIDYHKLHFFAIPLMILSWGLLVLVLFLPSIAGVHRWIRLPGIGQFQPSEIAKFSIIVLFAHLISINHKRMKTFIAGYLPFIIILGITAVLILKEPHLSGTVLVVAIGMCMMFIGGTRFVYLIGTVLLGIGAVLIVMSGYQKSRIEVWLDPIGIFSSGEDGRNAAWQTVQSLYAIGSGGFMGQGLGNSRQKHMFLPEGHNDFIFAVFCEEMGLVGALLVLILFALLVWRGITIGLNCKDKFGSMLAIGLTLQIGLQVFLNIAVVTNTIPNTGISLPFFSYGGTSLIMLLAQMGVVLSVSRNTKMSQQE